MKAVSSRLCPLAAWLILAGALITLFPLKLEHLEIIIILVTLLSLSWLPKKRLRSAPFLLLYVAIAILALNVSLPLPNSWHPLAQLTFVITFWALALSVPLATLVYYLFHTARAQDASYHSRQ